MNIRTEKLVPPVPHEVLVGDQLIDHIASFGSDGLAMEVGMFGSAHLEDFGCIEDLEKRLGKRIGDVTICIGPDEEEPLVIKARVRLRQERDIY